MDQLELLHAVISGFAVEERRRHGRSEGQRGGGARHLDVSSASKAIYVTMVAAGASGIRPSMMVHHLFALFLCLGRRPDGIGSKPEASTTRQP